MEVREENMRGGREGREKVQRKIFTIDSQGWGEAGG